MARSESEAGCGTVLSGLFFLGMAYLAGLWVLGEQRQWWHYLAALPLGILYLWVVHFDGGEVLVKWLAIPATGIGLLIWLLKSSLYLGTIGAGVAFFVIGVFCNVQAIKQQSSAWAVNSVIARILGLIMCVIGLVMHFVF